MVVGRTVDAARLGFNITPKLDFDSHRLAAILGATQGVTYFCDTNMWDHRDSEIIWPPLLSGANRVIIIPHVREELQPWLDQYPACAAARAVLDGDDALELVDYSDLDDVQLRAYTYYVNLLGFRKRAHQIFEIAAEKKLRRPLTSAEIALIPVEIQRQLGERGFLLAKKGARQIHDTYYTDEILVFAAFERALRTREEVVILTKDEDLLEQFYKLQWLLDTHYRGMLLADAYAEAPSEFEAEPMPATPAFAETFEAGENLLLRRSAQPDELLPKTYEPVSITCWVVGDALSEMMFEAETPMNRLLGVKGATGGLNTTRLSGRNCHIWLGPMEVPQELRDCAAIAMDRRVKLQLSDVEIPILDVNQAINTIERFVRVAP